jgi:hypothetical protein
VTATGIAIRSLRRARNRARNRTALFGDSFFDYEHEHHFIEHEHEGIVRTGVPCPERWGGRWGGN